MRFAMGHLHFAKETSGFTATVRKLTLVVYAYIWLRKIRLVPKLRKPLVRSLNKHVDLLAHVKRPVLGGHGVDYLKDTRVHPLGVIAGEGLLGDDKRLNPLELQGISDAGIATRTGDPACSGT